MSKYQSKPTIIEAEQWFPNKTIRGVYGPTQGEGPEPAYYVITIHNQKVYLDAGDWIITEPDGIHYYPCKPDIFEKRYELIKE